MLENESLNGSEESNSQTTTEQASTATDQPNTPNTDAATVLKNLEDFKRTTLSEERNARLRIERQLQETQRQLELARQNTVAQTPITEEDSKKFFEAPHAETRRIVKEVLEQSAKPLLEEIRSSNNENKYDKLKEKFSKHPKVGDLVSRYGDYIDQAMTGMEVNDQSMLAAITQVSGMLSLGMIEDRPVASNAPVSEPQKAPETKKAPVSQQPLPSTLSPSAPPAPAPRSQTKAPELTETDLAAMRIYGWNPKDPASVADYLAFRDHDGPVDSLLDIGKKK